MRAVLALVAGAALAGAATAAEPGCDRACLADLATRTVDALVHRGASSALPWAARVGYGENGAPMMVDDGIWATVTAHGAAPLVVADPATRQIVWMGVIEEHGQPSFLALRLRAEGRALAELRAVIRRREGRPPFADPTAFAFADMGPGSAATASAGRGRLAGVAKAYYAATAARHLAPGCVHTENGVALSGGCAPPTGVEAVRGLRVAAVDEARGLVAVTGMRDYSGAVPPGGGAPADAPFPHSYVFVAVLRIQSGAIARIQEVSSAVPYRMPILEAWP